MRRGGRGAGWAPTTEQHAALQGICVNARYVHTQALLCFPSPCTNAYPPLPPTFAFLASSDALMAAARAGALEPTSSTRLASLPRKVAISFFSLGTGRRRVRGISTMRRLPEEGEGVREKREKKMMGVGGERVQRPGVTPC